MSDAEVAMESSPRRSLRRSTQEQKQEQKQESPERPLSTTKKRPVQQYEDAPVLDGSIGKEMEEEEDVDDTTGPPPLKKVARTSAGGGTIMWKTATGAPKQLAFRKIGAPMPLSATNRSLAVQKTVPKVHSPVNGSSAPTNLATALAGLLPTKPTFSPSPSTSTAFPKRHVILKPVASMSTSAGLSSSPSTSRLSRRRVEKVHNEMCNNCLTALPPLRRSLGRLESRMEAVSAMVKSLVNKHSSQSLTMTRPAPIVVPRGQSTISSLSSPTLNGDQVIGKPTTMRLIPMGSGGKAAVSTPNQIHRQFVSKPSARVEPRTFMHRMISRGMLTYRYPLMTVEEFYKQAPTVIRAHSLKQVQEVMLDLIDSGLYKQVDESVDPMDVECIFEKETDLSKLSSLSLYEVSSADFLAGCFED